jgi:hypothetical protein
MRRLKIALVASLILAGSGPDATAAARRMILHVEQAPLAWADSQLDHLLLSELSRNPELRIVPTVPHRDGQPLFPAAAYDIDSLLNWGTEIGGRYLLFIQVNSEELEKKKTFNVPLFFQRWETIGVIRGEMRLLDLQKQRLLSAEPFEVKLSGAMQFQGEMDNNRSDPSLHLTAPEKSQFFGALEAKLVEKLADRVTKLTRSR